MINIKTKVFLSYKFHDNEGNILPDYYMAKELYERLSALGISTFFSDKTILALGNSNYKQLIDSHLDEAEMLVVVATSPDNCNSNWVRYEWDSFYNDLLSERKKGELLSFLDTDNVGDYPRTIRSLQVFKKNENGLEGIVSFIKNYFGYTENNTYAAPEFKGSAYNYDGVYELGDERKRLMIQGKVESKKDYPYISELLPNRDKVYNILDVGCSMGSVTVDVFGAFKDKVKVIGVDKFDKCVSGFNDNTPDNMSAEKLNFEDEDWQIKLAEIMKKHNVESFDLIYCALSLHHMSDSAGVVKKLWKKLSNNGYIYIRTCDDALKIAYPNEKYVYDILSKTAAVPGVSDRYHGRKVYSMLYRAMYKNIRIKSFLIDTEYKDMDERYALFYSAFVWRKNYFKNMLDRAKTKAEIDKAMKEYNEIMSLLDKIENLFMDSSFYFGYYVTIAIAQKRSIL